MSAAENREFEIDGVRFLQRIGPSEGRGVSQGDSFVIVKTDAMMDFYRGLADAPPRTVMEIGMYEGGSRVWLDKLYRPDRIVGVDLRRDPIEPLEAYRERNPQVVTYYGRNQAGPGTPMAARQNFPGGIDLVVDDASHLYEPSRETFNALFPMVRAGGLYVIEDWGWSHQPGRQGEGAVWAPKPALTNLVLEIMALAVCNPIVAELRVLRGLVAVRKGEGAYRGDMLDPSDRMRGRDWPLL